MCHLFIPILIGLIITDIDILIKGSALYYPSRTYIPEIISLVLLFIFFLIVKKFGSISKNSKSKLLIFLVFHLLGIGGVVYFIFFQTNM